MLRNRLFVLAIVLAAVPTVVNGAIGCAVVDLWTDDTGTTWLVDVFEDCNNYLGQGLYVGNFTPYSNCTTGAPCFALAPMDPTGNPESRLKGYPGPRRNAGADIKFPKQDRIRIVRRYLRKVDLNNTGVVVAVEFLECKVKPSNGVEAAPEKSVVFGMEVTPPVDAIAGNTVPATPLDAGGYVYKIARQGDQAPMLVILAGGNR